MVDSVIQQIWAETRMKQILAECTKYIFKVLFATYLTFPSQQPVKNMSVTQVTEKQTESESLFFVWGYRLNSGFLCTES